MNAVLGSAKEKMISGLVLFVLVLLYFFSYFNYGINLFDEGVLLEGVRLEQQDRMDFDKFCHYSSQYRFFSFILAHTQDDLFFIRLIWVLLRSLTALMIYLLARRLMTLPFALLPVILFLALPGPWHKSYIAFLICLTTFLMVKTVEKGSPIFYMLVAASLSLAVSIHVYTGGLTLVACSVFSMLVPIFENNKKAVSAKWKLLWHSVFGFVFIIATFIFAEFIRESDLLSFFSMTFQVLQSDYAGSRQMFHRLLAHMTNPGNLFILGTYFTALGTMISVLFMLLRQFPGHQSNMKKKIVTLLFIVSAFNLAKWLARFDMAHLLQNVSLIWIMIAFVAYVFFQQKRKVGFGFILTWLIALAIFGLTSADYYHGSLGYRLFNDTVLLKHPKAPMHVTKEEADWIMKMDQAIRENTAKDEPICVMAPAPILYYLSERKNPLVLPIFDRPESLKANSQESLIRQIRQNETRLVILKDEATDGVEEYKLSSFAPDLYQMVMDDYALLKTIDGYQIWVLK